MHQGNYCSISFTTYSAQDLTSNNVHLLVRACEATYVEDELLNQGIKVEELMFPDGQLPAKDVIDKWLNLVDDFFDGPESDKSR